MLINLLEHFSLYSFSKTNFYVQHNLDKNRFTVSVFVYIKVEILKSCLISLTSLHFKNCLNFNQAKQYVVELH